MPMPGEPKPRQYELDYQPADEERLIPVIPTGSKTGQQVDAERFARRFPDAAPDVQAFAAEITEDPRE